MSGASNLSTFWQWDHVCGQLWGVGLYYWKRAFYFRGCFNEWSLVSLSFSRVWYCHYRLHIRELTAWPQRQRHREREREREREKERIHIWIYASSIFFIKPFQIFCTPILDAMNLISTYDSSYPKLIFPAQQTIWISLYLSVSYPTDHDTIYGSCWC